MKHKEENLGQLRETRHREKGSETTEGEQTQT